ncbi:hypothetical protein GLP21_12050 [Photobacterium carnosum]|uniref:Uncharacterized protein n=1 Tax=Photobacterium carnosum TaxID=2023717 RepID=A0A2N4UVZ0_9GAMM|nr:MULTISPECIES: hypothetical protein [Photobacterium]MCD9475790.1 hypothetical protein [Photobacterium phosphoreum]MCD9485848.1 hypothetical protein [Photobacterium iliopiscarium]MCD9507651.1 hypothetical protein [Photobacterium phosphoreum]MCD9539519.1 hypothetical protein [Photobacterium carnosum]MCD9543203.1 hypothetical protein [Photobacterium carnosum]
MTANLCKTQEINQLLEDKCESIVWVNNSYLDPIVLTDIKLFIMKNTKVLRQQTDPKILFKESLERYVIARKARKARNIRNALTTDDKRVDLKLFFDELDAKIGNPYFRELFIMSKFNPINLFIVHFVIFIASQLITGTIQEYFFGDTSLTNFDLFMVVLFAVSYLISFVKLLQYENSFINNIR